MLDSGNGDTNFYSFGAIFQKILRSQGGPFAQRLQNNGHNEWFDSRNESNSYAF